MKSRRALLTTSLAFSVLAMLLSRFPFVGLACGVAGIGIALHARKCNPERDADTDLRGYALACVICGVVGVVLSALSTILFLAATLLPRIISASR